MDHPKSDRRDERGLDADPVAARKVDLFPQQPTFAEAAHILPFLGNIFPIPRPSDGKHMFGGSGDGI
jgi:hypothetical protein